MSKFQITGVCQLNASKIMEMAKDVEQKAELQDVISHLGTAVVNYMTVLTVLETELKMLRGKGVKIEFSDGSMKLVESNVNEAEHCLDKVRGTVDVRISEASMIEDAEEESDEV